MALEDTGFLPPLGKSSVPHCVSSPPHLLPQGLAPQDTFISSPKILQLSLQQRQGGSTQVHGCRQNPDHTKLHPKQETTKLTCLCLQGPKKKRLELYRRKLGRK